MSNGIMISNIVEKEKMREVQSKTLETLKNALMNSFGPMGSNTIIKLEKALTKYTKDGHTILTNILFKDVIENSVKSDLEDITRHIVKKIGDGTTSSVILSHIIFENLKRIESEGELLPYEIIEQFKNVVEELKEDIMKQNQHFDANTAYDITYISTNGNKTVSENIKNIYEEFGNDVFVDVAISNTTDTYLKTYDGMTLEAGYSDTAYINNKAKGVCSLRNSEIYCFSDPIDTPELMQLFDTIIYENIMKPYSTGIDAPIPTVIMAPTISRDLSSHITKLVEFMYKFPDENQKPPFLLITNIYQQEQFSDIARMCGCKSIRKYIDKKIYDEDVKQGLAATIETVREFAGSADIVESDLTKTKFVNPKLMHDENGELSDTFKTLVTFLESELAKAYEENENANVTGTLKRRINSLKANMVEYLVGGVSASDRDALRDLVEDSVLNCRAAALNGAGYGANFEGLRAAAKLKDKSSMHRVIYDAYKELATILYSTCVNRGKAEDIVAESLEVGTPFNMRTKEFDNKVLCSITTDVVVLDAISQIITLMFTSNQFLTPTPVQNIYLQCK